MDDIRELIRHYGLDQDDEHIIIPLPEKDGRRRRCFFLKRRYVRIVYPDGHFADETLGFVIEATVRYPELRLTEALYLLHKEMDEHISELFNDKKGVG